jgi:putative MFS transporter
MSSAEVAAPARFSAYQRRLLVFLSVACFFEGYDFFALSQLLPNLRESFGLTEKEGTHMVGVINAGTVVAYAMVRLADRLGRRQVLTITIAGYTLLTLLSGFAPNAVAFTICQFLARIFLIGEWATAMVIAAEEFPAARRGHAIGLISAATGLGSIVCAVTVPMLLKFGWQWVYFVGVIPLVLVGYSRRSLRETERFQATKPAPPDLFRVWRTHGRRVVELGLIWFLCYTCTQNAVFFWKEFAVHERELTDAQVGGIVAISAGISLPVAFAAGYLLDVVGRKIGAAVILSLLAVGVFGAYTAHERWLLTVALSAATIGVNCTLTLLNAFTTELFPTAERGAAFAWSNNAIGRLGYWLSPFLVGELVASWGWGGVLRLTAILPLVALLLIWLLLPETRARELEETAGLAK